MRVRTLPDLDRYHYAARRIGQEVVVTRTHSGLTTTYEGRIITVAVPVGFGADLLILKVENPSQVRAISLSQIDTIETVHTG